MTARQFSEQTDAVKFTHATDSVSNVSYNLEFECTGLLFHADYYFAAIDMVEIYNYLIFNFLEILDILDINLLRNMV